MAKPKDVKHGASSVKPKAKDAPKVKKSEPTPAGKVKEDLDDERKWKAESALETLARAEEHKRDKDLMRDVKSVRDRKVRDLANVTVETAPKLPR